MWYSRVILLLVLGSCMVKGLTAQQRFAYPFRHISQADGLLHNEVLSITQDRKGYIWIATRGGLQRYDGASFIYYHEMLSNASEGRNSGVALYADKKKDRLWISNDYSIEKMDLAQNRFTLYNTDSLVKDPTFRFTGYRDEQQQLWLLNENAVIYRDTITGTNYLYRIHANAANTRQTSYTAIDSAANGVWVAPGAGLLFFDNHSGKVYAKKGTLLQRLLGNLQSNRTQAINARFVMVDSRQDTWITTWGNLLYRFERATAKLHTYRLNAVEAEQQGANLSGASPLVNCILQDDHNTIWVGTEHSGLLRYNTAADNFDYCIAQEKERNGIRYDYKIFTLYQDREQNIWVGTDRGISIFNPYRQYFKSIRHLENDPRSIKKSEITSLTQVRNGDVFVGTWGGGFSIYDSGFIFRKNICFDNAPEKNKIWCFQQVDEQHVWIGCQHGFLVQYNLLTGAANTIQPPEMEGSTIRCMQTDNKGNVLFGLHNGKIVQWSKGLKRFEAFQAGPADGQKMEAVVNIFFDRAQHCWVSTAAGFKAFDPDKMVFTAVWLPGDSTGISGKTCQGIEACNDSTLLIATVYGGLNFFNTLTRQFKRFGMPEGLPSNTVYALKKDAAGDIWFTTDYGLYQLNPVNKKIIPYRMDPGLISSSFSSNTFYPLKDGEWATFTLAEVISFSPEKSADLLDAQPLKVEVTGFKLFDKTLYIDSLLEAGLPVQLNYQQNFFTLEFAALNYLTMRQTNYYHRLNGVDKDWVNGGTKRFANYTGLAPGTYRFEVKADNGNGDGLVTWFTIVINPPFWRTWWFICSVFACVVLLAWLFIKGREKSIRAIAAEKLKVQQLNAENYKAQFELEQITNYFASSLINKNNITDVLWDVAKNLIGQLGLVDCVIYLWNADKTRMIQYAGFGPKGSAEEIRDKPFDVLPGQGVVGYVIQTKEPLVIADTSLDSRYRQDDAERLSEITVPVIYDNELLGIIDSEHPDKDFYTPRHLQALTTIAALMATKINSIAANQLLQQTQIEMYSIAEQLSKAKLEALRAQMNPHFIFNCLSSIDNLIQMEEKEKATLYLSKFARLIRSILDNSINDTVPCWKDMETLQLYLELESLRFDDKFNYQLFIADEILSGDYKVPPLVIQPFVENAIHHGLLNKIAGDRRLLIRVSASANQVHYLIEDNGVGRAQADAYRRINQPAHRSMGMQITTDRINLFNQHNKGFVKITDLEDAARQPCGTRVTINLRNQS